MKISFAHVSVRSALSICRETIAQRRLPFPGNVRASLIFVMLISWMSSLAFHNVTLGDEPIPDSIGRFLLVSSEGLYVVESNGKASWSYQPTPYQGQGWVQYDDLIYDGCQLPNGNFLYAAHRYVREIDRDKKTVWEYRVPGRTEVKTCIPTRDGRVAVLNSQEQAIMELESGSGKVLDLIPVPAKGNDHTRYNLLRTTSANTFLVTLRDEKRFVEIDRDGKELLSLSVPSLPIAAARLSDGTTLCSGQFGLKRFDKNGKEIWAVTPQDMASEFPLIYTAGFAELSDDRFLVCNSDWHFQKADDNRVQLFVIGRDKKPIWTFPVAAFSGWKKGEIEPRTGFTEHRCAVVQRLQ